MDDDGREKEDEGESVKRRGGVDKRRGIEGMGVRDGGVETEVDSEEGNGVSDIERRVRTTMYVRKMEDQEKDKGQARTGRRGSRKDEVKNARQSKWVK